MGDSRHIVTVTRDCSDPIARAGLQTKTPLARSSLSVSLNQSNFGPTACSSCSARLFLSTFSHPPALNLPYLRIRQPSLLLLLYIFSHACSIIPPKPYALTASGPCIQVPLHPTEFDFCDGIYSSPILVGRLPFLGSHYLYTSSRLVSHRLFFPIPNS